MQAPNRRPPVGVVFDSSIEDSIDRVLGLAMVLAFSSRNHLAIALAAGEYPAPACAASLTAYGLWRQQHKEMRAARQTLIDLLTEAVTLTDAPLVPPGIDTIALQGLGQPPR